MSLWPEILPFVGSVIGGGLLTAIGGWTHANRSARREREVSWLQEQLRMLYGPLAFFASQNAQLFVLSQNIQEAHEAHFAGRWSETDAVQNAIVEAGSATTTLSNMYIQRVIKNNRRVMGILEANWHLVDSADTEIFSRFQVDYTRLLTEVKQQGGNKVPFQIRQRLGPIAYMRPDMIARVQEAVEAKTRRLSVLRSR